MRRSARPSTLERFSGTVLPPVVHRVLSGEEFVMSHLIHRALFGSMSGTVLYLGVIHNLLPTFNLKLVVGVFFVALCTVVGALVSSFRCLVLLLLPSVLGSRGRGYLIVFTLSLLYKGPVSNMHRNVETAALSLSCNLDLQLNNSKLLWRDAVKPFVLITQELVQSKAEFESDVLNISRRFQSIRDEVVLQYGYNHFTNKNHSLPGNSTQQRFTARTRMQCNGVVEEGVQRCAGWFRQRWEECMEVIPVPVISHVLCVSMKLDFLCDVMRVMTPWCTQQIPVEGNFGKLFDQLNGSVDQLSREFSAELVLQEQHQQAVLGGAGMDQNFTQSVTESFKNLSMLMKQLMSTFHVLLSFTLNIFIIITHAITYLRRYRRDIQFDNIYITTHFRQMDEDRRNAVPPPPSGTV